MKVKEIGNLTADPKYGEKDDIKYCNFSIAVNNPFDKEDTEFVKVSAFGKQAELCRDYLQKGSQVCIEGRVKAGAYIDNQGNPQATLNINANEVQFLNRIKQQEGRPKTDAALRNFGANNTCETQSQSQGMVDNLSTHTVCDKITH